MARAEGDPETGPGPGPDPEEPDRAGAHAPVSKNAAAEDTSVDDAPSSGSTIEDYFAFEEVFTRVLATADHELAASSKFLFWSGLGAGLVLGLTFLARVVFTHAAGEAEPGLLGNILYPIGFIIIVIGRYQLFTENTLTPVVLVLTKLASLRNLLRLWMVVFAANMLGAILVSSLLAFTDVLKPEQQQVALEIGRHAHATSWYAIFSRAVVAGWLVAAMVWLVHGGRDTTSKIIVVWFLTYFIGVGGFFHVVTSSVDVFYLSFMGQAAFWPLWPAYIAPIFLGNTLGGIVFVSIINTIQFGERDDASILKRYGQQLTWRAWIFGRSGMFGHEGSPVK